MRTSADQQSFREKATKRREPDEHDSRSLARRNRKILDRERIVAGPGFNRWLVPPAALAIHLCIGMAYGFSVFWLPMTRLIPNADATPARRRASSPNCSRPRATGPFRPSPTIFEIFIAVLGISAAIWGGWLEHAGPRKAGLHRRAVLGRRAGVCGIARLDPSALARLSRLRLIGGIGQGLGYITPVSTLIKWFPDRRGMATGFAIMGYGGGAMIGAPLAVWLMAHFAAPASPA